MDANKINDLVQQIRDKLGSATNEQKSRFVDLLEQIVTQEAVETETAESLAQAQKYMERLLPSVKKISKDALYKLHDFEMQLRTLAPETMENQRNRIADVMAAIEEAIDAVDLLQSRVYDIETALVQSIQRTGWDIKDLNDQTNFAENIASKPMSKLDLGPRDSRCYLKGYKCYQNNQVMVNPYDPDSAEYRDWSDGYHQAVIDRAAAAQ
jgi:methyl-accepting chemotaxis protein